MEEIDFRKETRLLRQRIMKDSKKLVHLFKNYAEYGVEPLDAIVTQGSDPVGEFTLLVQLLLTYTNTPENL
ncbi:MAG: hypothetical protein GWN31_08320 [Candidatus Thorarchaeota archaeon]|nr:hypothetical protein [Candidatus Thorarchaeota archaeon]NIW13922.1 hypothetical protein [Candidatus Thorarchaeota archaeon]NIW52041.1 hypothetical protein [Candidatus Korarchaeota archaeon]